MASDTGSTLGSDAHDELDELFDRLVDAAQQGETFDLDAWLAGREHLRARAEHLAGLAQGVAGSRGTAPPSPPGFTIMEELGRGGMGVVYRARQERPRRSVALKVTRATLASPRSRRRFELEAEVLARLEHPGIARIYASGIDPETDEPFFAMELVDGRPLDEHAADRSLSTRDRLRLLAQVCDAVEHAHQKGIIHRDLKPSNILVDAEGRTRVLDFGIARTTDSDVSIASMRTDVGALIGTLPYMSPEQAGGDPNDIDTRSDVYALGVVAYKLLTDRLPYDVEQKLVHEAVRAIQQDDPTPLSSINRTLGGDVQTIVAKALEKEKARRYQSAAALAEDLRRYLDDVPIAARPASAAYQLRKFARRNKALVAGAVATAAVLIAGVAATTWQAVAATRARDEARANLELAESRASELEQVADFQAGTVSGINIAEFGTILREGLVEQVREAAGRQGLSEAAIGARLDSLASTLEGADLSGLALRALDETLLTRSRAEIDERFAENLPLVRAFLLQRLATTYTDLGLLERAVEPQTTSLEIRLAEQGEDEYDTLLAFNNTGYLLERLGRRADAVEYYEKARDGAIRVLGSDNSNTLIVHDNLGTMLRQLKRFEEAERNHLYAFEGFTRTLGPEHPSTLVAMHNLGLLYGEMDRIEEEAEFLENALRLRRKALGDDHPRTISSIANLAYSRTNRDRPEEALALAEEATERAGRVYSRAHWRFAVYRSYEAIALGKLGRFEESARVFDEAFDLYLRTLGADHWRTRAITDAIAEMHDDWHAADPSGGHDATAAAWRARFPDDEAADSP